MAMFRQHRDFDADPFTDLLFNALLAFTFLFLVALMFLNPPAKSGTINPKADFIITVTWPDNNPDDIDTWVEGPAGQLVWFGQWCSSRLSCGDCRTQLATRYIRKAKLVKPVII